MTSTNNNYKDFPIAYKWISFIAVLGFVYYWVFTMFSIGFAKSFTSKFPKQHIVHNVLVRQSWKLFSNPSILNRHIVFITRDINNIEKTDTLNLTTYFIKNRIKDAPFNNYDDALDHILYRIGYYFEEQLKKKIELLKKQYPNKPNSFYRYHAGLLVEQDIDKSTHLKNLIQLGKKMYKRDGRDSLNKEYALMLINNYIPPYKPGDFNVDSGIVKPSFISSFKPFK